jgi:hypothetical protein
LKQNRTVLEENLINVLQESKMKTKKKDVNDIKNHLANNYDIISTQSWINDPEANLPSLDLRELLLFTEAVFARLGDLRINVEDISLQQR